MVEAIPPHPMSDDRDVLFDVRSRSQARSSLQAWRDSLRSGATSNVFRLYLDVALICGFGTLKETDQSFTGQLDEDVRAPIYQYRVGACDSAHGERLRRSRCDAAYVDADFALGRYALDDAVNPDQDEAVRGWRQRMPRFRNRQPSASPSAMSIAVGRNGPTRSPRMTPCSLDRRRIRKRSLAG
jgi:hypothetical protein